MVSPNRRQRPGRILFWLIAASTLLFVALTAYHYFMRLREPSDAAPTMDLSNALIAEDGPTLSALTRTEKRKRALPSSGTPGEGKGVREESQKRHFRRDFRFGLSLPSTSTALPE